MTTTEAIVEIDGEKVCRLSDEIIQIINRHANHKPASASYEAANALAICAALLMRNAPPDAISWFHEEVDRLISQLQPKPKPRPKLHVVPS